MVMILCKWVHDERWSAGGLKCLDRETCVPVLRGRCGPIELEPMIVRYLLAGRFQWTASYNSFSRKQLKGLHSSGFFFPSLKVVKW